MSDGEVRTLCTSSHCSARQVSCVLFFAQNRGWFKFVAVRSHVLEEVGDKTCGSERLQQRRHSEKGVMGTEREANSIPHPRALSTQHALLAFLLWLKGLDHGCHHSFVPLSRRFAFHLHAMFHLAIVVHSLSQEAQPPPPRQPPAQDCKGQHPAPCTPHSGGLSGRMAAMRTSFSQKPTC